MNTNASKCDEVDD